MIYRLLNLLFNKIKHPYYEGVNITREERQFILSHWPTASV